MTHLPYIVSAYAIFAAATLWLTAGSTLRLRAATRRARAADPRAAQTP